MGDNNRRKLLEAYAKQVGQGNPLSEDLVRTQLPEFNPDEPATSKYRIQSAVNKRALQARDLAEDSLANEVMRNTGIPIPNDNDSRLKKEDFLKQLIQERYPELKMEDDLINLSMMNDPSVPEGIYNSDNGQIFIKQRPDIVKNLSTALHETGHKYDMEHLNFDGTPDVNRLEMKKSVLEKGARAINDIDPTEAYEVMAKGHHARIPNLRDADSFGLGALKSYLQSGKFKAETGPLGALLSSVQQAYQPDSKPVAIPEAQAKIAAAYEAMKHNPNDHEVKKAYDNLISEVEQQYDDLINSKGLKVSKIAGENPYKTSKDLINDVRSNNHMSYYPTDIGYGADGASAVQDHPMLRQTKFLDAEGKPMPANDLFRVVHDYYGHVDGDNKFGATGEERAFQQHKKMLSPEAQKALATETRGQNSWVNYGPQGEANRKNPANTVYAEQKAGLLPQQYTKSLDEISSPKMSRLHAISSLAAKTLAPVGLASAVVPFVADLKEGKPNTALARGAMYTAPIGTEEISDKLMDEAQLRDESPELYDASYVNTLKRIGERRAKEGRSPVVETISGRQVDTSATEDNDFENRVKALQKIASEG